MIVQRALRMRMDPTGPQEEQFRCFAGARRWVWNWALERQKRHYESTRKHLPASSLERELPDLKKDPSTAWLAEVHSQLLQQALRDLDRAWQNFFNGRKSSRKVGPPAFRSKKRHSPTFRIPQGVRLEGDRLYVPKIGWVRVRNSYGYTGEVKSATFRMEPDGHWYVSLGVEQEIPDHSTRPPRPEKVEGVDLGLCDFLVASDGTRVPAPRFYRKAEGKLRKLHRQLSRKQKGSRNREKARLRLARCYAKVRHQRQDFLHKLSTNLVDRRDAIAAEDPDVKGLARTKLAKSIRDASWGEFLRQLEYKARWNGKVFRQAPRFFPSTKTCNACGHVQDVPRSAREWTCERCGAGHDRNLNAARNLKDWLLRELVAVGHTDTQNACGGGVRPGKPGGP